MPGTNLAKSQRYTQAQIDHWRGKLQVGQAINVLNQAVKGELECSTARMKAIEITLRKTVPDLTSVELTSGGEPIQFAWGNPTTIVDMTANTADISDKPQNNSDIQDTESGDRGAEQAPAKAPEKQE